MSDDEHLKSVNDLNTGAVVTNLTAVPCSIHKLGDQGELSLQKSTKNWLTTVYIIYFLNRPFQFFILINVWY